MGRGADTEVVVEGAEMLRRPRRRRFSSPVWRLISSISPADARRRLIAADHADGTGGALPTKYAKHHVLWWTIARRDDAGNMHQRFFTVGRRRLVTADRVAYPETFCCIRTVRDPVSGRTEVTSLSSGLDLEWLVDGGLTFDLGNEAALVERDLDRQRASLEDAGQMIAHRLGLQELSGCEGVHAAIAN